MSVHQSSAGVAAKARIVAAPAARPNRAQRVFDLHPAVHLTLIAAYLSFVGILLATFMGRDLPVAAGIVLLSVVALFLVPALWARVVPDEGLPRQSWADFCEEGVDCITGRLSAGAAFAQILVLPGLMVALAIFFAFLKAAL